MLFKGRNPMSLLTFQEVKKLEEACLKLFDMPEVQFAGIINNKGRLIAGGFYSESVLFKKEKLSMIFLELFLDYSMRRDSDSILGKISYMTTHRHQTKVTTIPFNEDLILIFSVPNTNVEDLVEKSNSIFNDYLQNQV
jgi:hypothetical protein